VPSVMAPSRMGTSFRSRSRPEQPVRLGEGVVDASVDAAESWLFDINGQKQRFGDPPADMAELATRTVRRYSMQRGLNTLWNQCLWRAGGPFRQRAGLAGGRRISETATFAGGVEDQASENFMNFPHIDRSVWIQMTPQSGRGAPFRGRSSKR